MPQTRQAANPMLAKAPIKSAGKLSTGSLLPQPYNGQDTLDTCWQTVVQLRGTHTAIKDPHTQTSLTYQELDDRIAHLAHIFQHELGWQAGQCIGLLMPNSWAFIASFMACQRIGVVVSPLSWRLTEAELIPIIKDAAMVGLITEASCIESWSRWSSLPIKNVVLNNANPLPQNVAVPVVSLPHLMQSTPSMPPKTDTKASSELAVLVYTSGTTGIAKGVMLSQANILADVWANQQVIEASPDDVFITTSPLFHVFGLANVMLTSLLAGATLVVLPRFSPAEVLESIEAHQVTFLAAVPTMYQMMLTHMTAENAPTYNLTSLRVCHSGAAPMHKSVFEAIETHFGPPVQEGYGQSEGSSIITSNPLHGTRKPGSIGVALPGLTVEIVDENDTVLPPSEVGELRVSGPTVMMGYWDQPERTDTVLRNGWLYTRDMGYTDEDGYIFLVDRQDDMMNVGGNKVFPREIEEVIYEFPGILRCAVKAEPSDLFGQVPAAYVVLDATALPEDGSPQTLINGLWKHCHDSLARYKLPKIFYRMNSLPTGATGKLLRHQLRSSDAEETIYPVMSS